MQQHVVMAIDPGLRRLGLAVATDSGRLLAAEVVTTDPTTDVSKRLKHLELTVEDRLERFQPNRLVLEKTWPTRSRPLAVTRRVALMCRRRVIQRRIPVTEASASTVREVVAGWGWATKSEAAQVVASIYPELQIYLRQDRAWKERHFQNLFDAVALLLYERIQRIGS